MLKIDLIMCGKVRFCWGKDTGCKVISCSSNATIGNTHHIPYSVTIASSKKLAGFKRVVQYAGHGFVYLNHNGQRKELFYDMFEERYFIE